MLVFSKGICVSSWGSFKNIPSQTNGWFSVKTPLTPAELPPLGVYSTASSCWNPLVWQAVLLDMVLLRWLNLTTSWAPDLQETHASCH